MIERWQIYAVPLGVITPGAAPVRVPFHLDNDAPFILRGRSIGVVETAIVNSPAYVRQLWTRFNTPAEYWNANDVVPSYVDMGPAGGAGAPAPWYSEQPYPAGHILQTDVYNDGVADGTNPVTATMYYHGVKLYPDGVYAPTYPATCNPKAYAKTAPRFGDPALTLATVANITDYEVRVSGDADYVFRGGMLGWTQVAGDADTVGFRNLTCVVKNRDRRAFMNAPCHVYHVFGIPGAQGTPTTKNPIAGSFMPGLFVPEIYVNKREYIYLDFTRADGGLGLNSVNIQMVFSGSKVYPA